MIRRRSSSSNSSVDTCDRVLGLVGRSAYPWDRALGLVRRSVGTSSVGFPTGQDGVDAARRPGQLVFQQGVGARAGLTQAVLDVGQRAHGELQAIGQIGAVAETQCHAPTHDVVAEPFQIASVHAAIMTDKGGNVESRCPFLSIRRTKQRNLFPRDSGQVGPRLGDRVPEDLSSTFSLDRPTTSTFATPASFPAHHLGLGQRLPGPPLLADGEGGNRTRSIATFAFNHRCEAYHYGNYFLTMDILASNF